MLVLLSRNLITTSTGLPRVQPIDQKIYTNEKQIQTLTKTRDTLLPKLMSGKLRVKDENIIEEGK